MNPRGRPKGKTVKQTPVQFRDAQLERLDAIAARLVVSRAELVREGADMVIEKYAHIFLPAASTGSN